MLDKRVNFVIDSDGDGLTDYQEVHTYGTDRFNRDTDYDYLSDCQEVYYNGSPDYLPGSNDTNANGWDTDGDGYCDGHEVNLGRNPLDRWNHPGETSKLVINEILYDYPGADGGHEFIELYNNQGVEVDLTGYRIEASGKKILAFPRGKKIAPYGYLLIGGLYVTDVSGKLPDIRAHITMQNSDGGGKIWGTDNVRLVRSDDYVLDTILYGAPNTWLFGDNSRPGQTHELCPDVLAGQSLGRQTAGLDSNNKSDFYVLGTPNPTSSADPDTDNDGLSNVDEAANGTDPLKPDCDEDGFMDGSEVMAHTNPLSASSKPQVKINEVYYDPAGVDETLRREFIELYNNEDYPVDIGGLWLQYGGQSFGYGVVTIPFKTVIPAKSYYLIGDVNVRSYFGIAPDMVCGLRLQNGDQNDPAVPYYGKGSPTDGVRLGGYGGKVADTVLYDTPNTNRLPGDRSNPAQSIEFCPDVQPGQSLRRVTPGVDSNSKSDWTSSVPSPTSRPAHVTEWLAPGEYGRVFDDWPAGGNVLVEDGVSTYVPDGGGEDYCSFNVPVAEGATIVGIEIALKGKRHSSYSNGVALFLTWHCDENGNGDWSADKSNSFPETSFTWKTYGGPTDLWGRTAWQVSDLSNANFLCVGAGFDADVDAIQLRVYYQQ